MGTEDSGRPWSSNVLPILMAHAFPKEITGRNKGHHKYTLLNRHCASFQKQLSTYSSPSSGGTSLCAIRCNSTWNM